MDFNRKCKEELLQIFELKDFPDNLEHSTEKLLCNRKIILYGAGAGFQTFLNYIVNRFGLKVHAVIDRKFQEKEIYYGIPAFHPTKYNPTSKEKQEAIVVITVTRPEYQNEIVDYLKSVGFQNITFAKNIYEFSLPCPPPELLEKGFNYYINNKEKILNVLDILADDTSREIYVAFMETHIFKKLIPIPHQPSTEQYFPSDINLKKGYNKFVHCGAYTGDTIIQMHENKKADSVESLICFEPDPYNYKVLVKTLSELKEINSTEIICFPCAVYSRNEHAYFKSAGLGSSIINNKEGNFVQCIALDTVLLNFKVTFISMDVEGSEIEALKGATALITRYRPDLAICVYHKPADIWEIPLFLNKLNLCYKFYLRNYRGFPIDTVLYATVDE